MSSGTGFTGVRRAANISAVIGATNLGAILLGVGSGGLTASLISLGLGGLLTVLNVESGAGIGLVIGVILGLAVGGWVAGRRARHSSRFHGSLTGLALAFLIVVVARFGGSPASTLTVVWLAILAIVVSGSTGWLADRTRAKAS